jgi:hypothetical protein
VIETLSRRPGERSTVERTGESRCVAPPLMAGPSDTRSMAAGMTIHGRDR